MKVIEWANKIQHLEAQGANTKDMGKAVVGNWKVVIQTFFTELQATFEADRQPDWPALEKALHFWESCMVDSEEHLVKGVARARHILEQSKQVPALMDQLRAEGHNDIDPIIQKLLVPGVNVQASEEQEDSRKAGWRIDCWRELLPRHLQRFWGARRAVQVMVALDNPSKSEESGKLALLELELVQPGAEEVFQHPASYLATYTYHHFRSAMSTAWLAARALAGVQSNHTTYNGRWRLLTLENSFLDAVDGDSAGAAAALGWYHLLNNTYPDPGIVVMATVDHAGNLGYVGGVKAKTAAVVAMNRSTDDCYKKIDTIVVADIRNQSEAETALSELKDNGQIRVVNLAAEPAPAA